MKKTIIATLMILPTILLVIIHWLIMLPQMLWEVPKMVYYQIKTGKVLAKVRVNEDGTYTIMYHGKEKTFTKEEFEEKFGSNNAEK